MGIPTVTVCTDAFVPLAQQEAAAWGMSRLPFVVVPHPVAPLSPEQVRARAAGCADAVAASLVQRHG